jgi:hypothetical protein
MDELKLIRNGMHVQMVNRSTGRIIFAATTPEISAEAFANLWRTLGSTIFAQMSPKNAIAEFEVRVTPLL